ncbi:HNH endonuclease [Streptomyces sp. NPDC020490]|uniref:HNH endonuclease n=1 Tax=Streptomyces sp. NPDC020490 TaxID=3365078 RepID=UPI0037B0D2E6
MTKPTCAISGCEQGVIARGWCHRHYKRWQTHGDPSYVPPVRDWRPRFWARVDKTAPGGCWVWTGSVESKGYGAPTINGAKRPAHRVAYEDLVGPIPEGLHLDHLCRVRRCVNPEHLEPVTSRENALRGIQTKLTDDQARALHERWRSGEGVTALAREVSMHPSTLHHRFRLLEGR